MIADEQRPLGLLFGTPDSRAKRCTKTRRAAIVAVQVQGVPDIAIEEAIWLAGG